MKKRWIICLILMITSLWFCSLVISTTWGINCNIERGNTASNLQNILIINNVLMFFGYLSFFLIIIIALLEKRWLMLIAMILMSLYFIHGLAFYGWTATAAHNSIIIDQLAIWSKIHLFYACLTVLLSLLLLIVNIRAVVIMNNKISIKKTKRK